MDRAPVSLSRRAPITLRLPTLELLALSLIKLGLIKLGPIELGLLARAIPAIGSLNAVLPFVPKGPSTAPLRPCPVDAR